MSVRHEDFWAQPRWLPRMLVYVIRDVRSRLDHPLGDAVDLLVRREDAKRFLDEVRRDDPELVRHLRIEERELDAGSLN